MKNQTPLHQPTTLISPGTKTGITSKHHEDSYPSVEAHPQSTERVPARESVSRGPSFSLVIRSVDAAAAAEGLTLRHSAL